MTTINAISTRELGGIGQPADLLRRPPLDGVVVLASAGPSDVAAAVRALCRARGWSVVEAATADRAAWAAAARKTSLVVVTATDPSFVLQTVSAVRRSTTSALAVLAQLSARERKASLAAGADLVLTSSLDADEVGDHLEALLRRAADTWEPQVRYLSSATLVVDLWARECLLDDAPLHLSRTEYELLVFLMRHPRQAIPIEKIIQRVWDSRAYHRQINAARIAISRLRTKLTNSTTQHTFVRSVRGVGYEFDRPVLEIGDGASYTQRPELTDLRLSTIVLDVAAALQTRSFTDAAQFCIDTVAAATGDNAGAIFYHFEGKIHLLAERGNPPQFRALLQRGVALQGRSEVHSMDLRQPTQVDEIARLAKISDTVKIMSKHGFHSYLYVPLVTGGRTWGGLRLASRASRPLDPVVTTFCSAVGAMLSMKLPEPVHLRGSRSSRPTSVGGALAAAAAASSTSSTSLSA